MIAKLSGRLDSAGPDHAVIDVGGVGYLVFCSGRTLARLGPLGNAVSVLVDTHVREDAITLYGFAESGERDWFRLLITVQGVGARVANALLSVLAPEDLTRAVAAQDKTALTRADGVGPKLATRIVSELKDKVGGIALGPAALAGAAAPAGASVPEGGALGDAVSALVNLGYGRTEAFGAVMAAGKELGSAAGASALIRQALQNLGRDR
ncbi:MAG: Holliday junction branch migration protein RuvA [Rhodospirillaceae bacterium]